MAWDLQNLLNTFKTHHSTRQAEQLHLLFLKTGVLFSTVSIANRLLHMYVRCGDTTEARFNWTTLLECYAKSGNKNQLLDTFFSMQQKEVYSWHVVLSGLVNAWELNVAWTLFREMPDKDGHAWDTLIHGCAKKGEPRMVLRLFKEFQRWDLHEMSGVLSWDPFIFATVVRACAELGSIELGKQVHGKMLVGRMEFDSVLGSSVVNMYCKCGDFDSARQVLTGMGKMDDFSLSTLISGYARCGRMKEAREIFDELNSVPCVVLWNSLISGYITNGEFLEGLLLFRRMNLQGVSGDPTTFSSILSACCIVGTLKQCMQLHAHVHKLGILYDLIVSSSLVDAYGKRGSYY